MRSTTSPLCIPGRADLDDVAAGLDDQVVADARSRSSGSSTSSARALGRASAGCGSRPRGPSPRRRRPRRPRGAGTAAARGGTSPARAAAAGRSPGGWSSSTARCRTGRRRRAPCRRRRSRCRRTSSPPRSSACRAGRPVMTATARTCSASSTSTSAASSWMWADAGSSTIGAKRAVEVQPDDRVRGRAHERGVLLLALGRAELHGPTPPHPTDGPKAPTGATPPASTVGRVPGRPRSRSRLGAARVLVARRPDRTAVAADGEAPAVATPTIAATSAASVR